MDMPLPEPNFSEGTSPRYAGFFLRFGATVIDWIVLTGFVWGIELTILGAAYWIFTLAGRQGELPDFQHMGDSFRLQLLSGWIYMLASLFYYGYGHALYGSTIGKRVFRLSVLSLATGLPPSLSQSWLRCFAYSLSYASLGFGYLLTALHPRKQALHDWLARTCVVRIDSNKWR